MRTMTLKVTRRDEEGNEILNESALKGVCKDLEHWLRHNKVSYERRYDNWHLFMVDPESGEVPECLEDCLTPLDMLYISIADSGASVEQVDAVDKPLVIVNKGGVSLFSPSINYQPLPMA